MTGRERTAVGETSGSHRRTIPIAKSPSPEVHNHSYGRQARVCRNDCKGCAHTHNCRVMAPCHLTNPDSPATQEEHGQVPAAHSHPSGTVSGAHTKRGRRGQPHILVLKVLPFPFKRIPIWTTH